MICLAAAATSLAMLGLAVFVNGAPTAKRARSRAGRSMAVVLVANILATVGAITLEAPGWDAVVGTVRLVPTAGFVLVPIVFALVGVVVVSLAPVASHPPRTLARIVLVLASAFATVATDFAGVIVAAWVLSAWVTWLELRSDVDHAKTASLFAGYQLVSGLCLVIGAALLALGHSGLGVPLLVLGIAVREAVLPLHTWFPSFVETAPLGLVVAFAAPQLGVYAHLSLLADHTPALLAHQVAAIGAVTAVGAAGLGLVQSEARRALAFLIISQTGLVAFGLENDSSVAQAGALVTWQVLAVAIAGFAMTLAALEARRGSLSLRVAAGHFAGTPRMGIALLILGFASVGFPLTLGFVAEDLLVQGSVGEYPVLGLLLIVATALNGMTVMRCFFFLFSGSAIRSGGPDLRPRERNALTAVILALVLAGTFPRLVVPLMRPPSSTVEAGHPSSSRESTAARPEPSSSSRLGEHSSQR